MSWNSPGLTSYPHFLERTFAECIIKFFYSIKCNKLLRSAVLYDLEPRFYFEFFHLLFCFQFDRDKIIKSYKTITCLFKFIDMLHLPRKSSDAYKNLAMVLLFSIFFHIHTLRQSWIQRMETVLYSLLKIVNCLETRL